MELFSGMSTQDAKNMQEQLNMMGAPYSLSFREMSWVANTNSALQASEYARDHGKFHEYHEQLFYANFTEGKKLGEIDVLLDIAQQIGLDHSELKVALKENRYQARLNEAKQEAEKYQVTGTPTFIINEQYKLVGAQSLQKFRKVFLEISSERPRNPFNML